MTFTQITARRLIVLCCIGILVAALLSAASSSKGKALGLAVTAEPTGTLHGSSGKVRVYIGLDSNLLAADRAKREATQVARQGRASARAQARAASNPYLFTEQERRAASDAESIRNRALGAIRDAARPDAIANERIATLIERSGGEIHQSTPLPNSITATVPKRLIPTLTRNELVDVILPAGAEPHLMNSPVDGSETWHTNGFIGNGGSADGNGGPDFVAIDAGIRTTHLAFRSRLPGDPNNGPATGPSRITSPAGRVFFGGSEHANTVAATVANTDLSVVGWTYTKGLAYGVDKVYDPYQAQSGFYWLTGISYNAEPGVADLPEAANYSSGLYEDTTDFNPVWMFIDDHVASFDVTYSISAGNCGVEGGGFTGCSVMGQGPHRVSTPGNLHNTITVGGLDYNGDIYDPAVWIPWTNSSPGPTWGGRKKPDVIADPGGVAGGPSQLNDTAYGGTGTGTSYAAPIASAGALLLASAGIYEPTAQKAILINSATPIQSQTYWTPKSGWGALNLEDAFYQRANYANGTITPSAENGVRFFRATGVAAGDRSTLVWNRRTATASTYRVLTDLDLSQHDQTTGATTSTGGSDAGDSVDTDQTISVSNPMPGSGSDGGDNVEQVRSTSTGTQILKVKNIGAIDGLTAEPFSLASAQPVTPLETPVPTVALSTDPSVARPGETVTVTAQLQNSSSDIDLNGAQVTLSIPGTVDLTSGNATQNVTLTAGDSDVAVWQVEGSVEGVQNLSVEVTGLAYGESFEGADSTSVMVDGTPPTASAAGPAQWSTDTNASFSWSATDAVGIANYDVEVSRNGGAFELLAADTTSTSVSIAGIEGESLTIRVSATDTAGNSSSPSTHTTTIDAIPPQIALTPRPSARGTANVQIQISNIGAPVSATYFFGVGDGPRVPLLGNSVSYTNRSAKALTATVRVTATDAIGRIVSAAADVRVPSTLRSPNLRITSTKSEGGLLIVSGRAARSVSSRVSLLIERIGTTGTRRKRLRVGVKRGKFSARIKLAPGRYRVTASLPRSSTYLAQKSSKRTQVN